MSVHTTHARESIQLQISKPELPNLCIMNISAFKTSPQEISQAITHAFDFFLDFSHFYLPMYLNYSTAIPIQAYPTPLADKKNIVDKKNHMKKRTTTTATTTTNTTPPKQTTATTPIATASTTSTTTLLKDISSTPLDACAEDQTPCLTPVDKKVIEKEKYKLEKEKANKASMKLMEKSTPSNTQTLKHFFSSTPKPISIPTSEDTLALFKSFQPKKTCFLAPIRFFTFSLPFGMDFPTCFRTFHHTRLTEFMISMTSVSSSSSSSSSLSSSSSSTEVEGERPNGVETDFQGGAVGVWKLLQFHEDVRPAYWGIPFQKKSTVVTGRRPWAKDELLDYLYDSEAEWEEEDEVGEEIQSEDDDEDLEDEEDEENDELDEDEDWLVDGVGSDDSDEDEEEEEEEDEEDEEEEDEMKMQIDPNNGEMQPFKRKLHFSSSASASASVPSVSNERQRKPRSLEAILI
ncbi:Chromatin assembly factor 1, subunit A, partial [Coelomomyces lativittatus]